jgi:hypothetical protein
VGIFAKALEVIEDGLEFSLFPSNGDLAAAELGLVLMHLDGDISSRNFGEIAVLTPFDAGLHAQSNHEAEGDGEHVEEKIFDRVNGLVGWMNFDH